MQRVLQVREATQRDRLQVRGRVRRCVGLRAPSRARLPWPPWGVFGVLGRCRRLAKDWENLNHNALAFIRLASIRLMLRKLCITS